MCHITSELTKISITRENTIPIVIIRPANDNLSTMHIKYVTRVVDELFQPMEGKNKNESAHDEFVRIICSKI